MCRSTEGSGRVAARLSRPVEGVKLVDRAGIPEACCAGQGRTFRGVPLCVRRRPYGLVMTADGSPNVLVRGPERAAPGA